MKLFQYAVLWHPTEKQHDDENKQSRLLVEVTTIVAKDQQGAMLMAARKIPAEYMEQLDQIEVVIRPF